MTSQKLSQQTLNQYEKVVNTLSERTQAKLRNALLKVDFSNKKIAIKQIEEIVIALTGASTEIAGLVGANFYEEVSVEVTGNRFKAQAFNEYNPKSDFVAINALMNSVEDEQTAEKFINELAERIDSQIRKSANQSVYENGYRDKRKPRFARVPTYNGGNRPCLFCLMLASRGAVYYSKNSAGENFDGSNRYHHNCKCKVVPVFNDNEIENYNPDELYKQWTKGYEELAEKRAKKNGTTVDEEIREYKRKQQEASEKAYEKRKAHKKAK